MTTYIVHLHSEVRLVFEGIEADSHEAAAAIACDKHPAAADDIDSCDGENFTAEVEEPDGPARSIDFNPQRRRKVSPKLVGALEYVRATLKLRQLDEASDDEVEEALEIGQAAIDEATAAGILPHPPGIDTEAESSPEIARFVDFEIEPRIRHWEDGDPEKPDHSACEEHDADMWRLYGNLPGRDSVCIGEYAARALAEDVYAGITGRRYTRQS